MYAMGSRHLHFYPLRGVRVLCAVVRLLTFRTRAFSSQGHRAGPPRSPIPAQLFGWSWLWPDRAGSVPSHRAARAAEIHINDSISADTHVEMASPGMAVPLPGCGIY